MTTPTNHILTVTLPDGKQVRSRVVDPQPQLHLKAKAVPTNPVSTSTLPMPTPDLVASLIDAERTCMMDWLEAMRALPGNPLGIAIRTFGSATALVCSRIPAEIFNRVLGMREEDHVHISEILDFYAEQGAAPLFDLNPYTIPPLWDEPNLVRLLHQNHFGVGFYHQMLYGLPTLQTPALPDNITVREASATDDETIGIIYQQVWGGGRVLQSILGHPHFRTYIAYVNGEPAGLGVLHMANGVASMANGMTIPRLRGHGCHIALLYHRMAAAADAGCTLMVSQCRPGGSSQNNQVRVGLHIAGTKVWWMRYSHNG